MRKFLMIVFIPLLCAPCAAAEAVFDNGRAFGLENIEAFSLEAEPAVPAPGLPSAPAAPGGKEWTVMVFVNGKNDLEPFALRDMNEMELVGSSDKVNIVVELGRIAGHDSSDGDWTGVRRYLVMKDGDAGRIASPVLAAFSEADMGDHEHLIEFVRWAKAEHPARKYMLIVWNHGAGWWDKGRSSGGTRGISYDDETNNFITTPQLGLALKGMGGVDVYASDACLMQMPEVAYELRGYAEYVVGSEETVPADGYPYERLLAPLAADPSMTPEALGRLAVDAYGEHYQSVELAFTHSLLNTQALTAFIPKVNAFVKAARASGEKDLVRAAAAAARNYADTENKDMWNFLELYGASTKSAAVRARARELQDYLDGSLVIHNRVYGEYAGGNSHGLAVYMPWESLSPKYEKLAWARDSKWDELIRWFLAK